MLTIAIIQELRNDGLTFKAIGELYGVTKQRVHAVYTGYDKEYTRRESFKEYRRHFVIGHVKRYKPCKYCENDI